MASLLVHCGAEQEHVHWHRPQNRGHANQHGGHRLVLKQHVARQELRRDRAQGPNVNFGTVGQAENHFRCSVRPRLHVRVQIVGGEARGPKINQLHFDLRKSKKKARGDGGGVISKRS